MGHKQISPAQIVCAPDAAWITSSFREINCNTLTSCAKISKLKTAHIKPSAITSTFPLSWLTVSRHLGPREDIHLFFFYPCFLCIQSHKGFLGSVPAAMGWRQFNILDMSATQRPSTLTFTFSLELPVNIMLIFLNSERNSQVPEVREWSRETQRERDNAPVSQELGESKQNVFLTPMMINAFITTAWRWYTGSCQRNVYLCSCHNRGTSSARTKSCGRATTCLPHLFSVLFSSSM